MNFWRKDLPEDIAETRADTIMRRKKRRQDPQARGLGAVAISRTGAKAIHRQNDDPHSLEGTTAETEIAGKIHDVKVLDLSCNGVMIAFDGPVEIGSKVRLAIDPDAPVTANVRWARQGRVGLGFIPETVIIAEPGIPGSLIRTIAFNAKQAAGTPGSAASNDSFSLGKRHPYVWFAKLRIKGAEATARLRNLSRTGAMVAISQPLALEKGSKVVLSFGHVGKIPATISWGADQQYGLVFRSDFDVSSLLEESYAELDQVDDTHGLGAPRKGETSLEDDIDTLCVKLSDAGVPGRQSEAQFQRLSLDEIYARLYPEEPAKTEKGPVARSNTLAS